MAETRNPQNSCVLVGFLAFGDDQLASIAPLPARISADIAAGSNAGRGQRLSTACAQCRASTVRRLANTTSAAGNGGPHSPAGPCNLERARLRRTRLEVEEALDKPGNRLIIAAVIRCGPPVRRIRSVARS